MKQSHTPHLHKRHLLVLILLAAAVLLSFAGVTAARYIQYQETSGLAQAPNFYFTSDLLQEKAAEEESAIYYIDPQNGNFNIKLTNAADSQRYTAKDILYTVEVTNGTEQVGDGANAGGYTLAGGSVSTAEITITPADDAGPDKPVTVSVASSKPYAKTLTAQFIPALGNQYSIEDTKYNTAAVLTMTCTASSGAPVTLSLPAGVLPDATDSRVKTGTVENSYTFTAPGQGVYALVLLKTNKELDLTCERTAFADSITITAST